MLLIIAIELALIIALLVILILGLFPNKNKKGEK